MTDCRVLVVEDDADNAQVIRWLLEEAGYQVETVGTCAAADTRLGGSPPIDVVLLDRRLPDGDGLDLCRAVRARSPSPPVVVLSAVSSVHAEAEGLAAGAVRTLAKPFDPDVLLAAVASLCAGLPWTG